MKKLRFLLCSFLIISLLLIHATGLNAAAAQGEDSEKLPVISLDAKSAALINMDTGALIYTQNGDERLFPASLTKIMTAMLAIEHGTLTDSITASENAMHQGLSIYGSNVNLQAGETMTLEQLLTVTLVSSANEACNVLAEYVSGTIEEFVVLMNEKAGELGCTDTHFANPHGLHDEDHYTTANDMAKIAYAAMQYPDFARICNITQITIPATNKSEARELHTTNYLLSNQYVGGYYLPYAKGVKTGFTTPAGHCLVSTAENDVMHILGVVLGADTFINSAGIERVNSFLQMEELFEWAFTYYAQRQIVFPTLPVAQVSVKYGADTNFVLVYPAEEQWTLLPKDYDTETLENVIHLDSETVEAPVQKGDSMGTMEVRANGVTLCTAELLALTNVERSGFDAVTSGAKGAIKSTPVKMILIAVPVVIIAYIVYMILYNKFRRKAIRSGTYKGNRFGRYRRGSK